MKLIRQKEDAVLTQVKRGRGVPSAGDCMEQEGQDTCSSFWSSKNKGQPMSLAKREAATPDRVGS